ncbi:MAG: ABC transporter permease [Gammaproteobacteria bacterium]|jgi:putative spermidine/putrescine transport system permease protein|nr:ABC transporter permease [Gammaproteobacteria bacterium]
MSGVNKIRRSNWYYFRSIVFYSFLLFLYGPIAVMTVLSFQGETGGLTFPMRGASVHWFADVFDPSYIGDFRWPFGRSVFLALIIMVLTMVISFLAGLAFRKGFRGNVIFFYLVVASLIAPSILISLGIGRMFTSLDMQSAWWSGALGAHLTWTLPFGVLIMLAIFSRFDPRTEEAARDLGATTWQTLKSVIIPITLPGLVGVALFGFTLSYDEFARTSQVSGEHNTLPLELVSVTGTASTPALYAIGTMTTIFSLLVIGLSFFILYIIQRRRAGSAKEINK